MCARFGRSRRCAVRLTKDKVCSDMKFIKEIHNAEGPSPARGKAIIFCIVAIIKNRIIMKLIYRTLLLNKVCAQGSGAAVVLLAKHINKVCSVPLLIKEIYNAQAIPSPAL